MPKEFIICGEIDVLAFAKTNDSLKISSQRSGLRIASLELDPDCIARIARFGAIATIDRRMASSFSL
jgi:hypothetical protein